MENYIFPSLGCVFYLNKTKKDFQVQFLKQYLNDHVNNILCHALVQLCISIALFQVNVKLTQL